MSCDNPKHIHQWPDHGEIRIERCEHLCQLCKGDKATKRWSSAWFLRRHVRDIHAKKEYPDLIVSAGWSHRPQGNTRPMNKKYPPPGSNKKRAGAKRDRKATRIRQERPGTGMKHTGLHFHYHQVEGDNAFSQLPGMIDHQDDEEVSLSSEVIRLQNDIGNFPCNMEFHKHTDVPGGFGYQDSTQWHGIDGSTQELDFLNTSFDIGQGYGLDEWKLGNMYVSPSQLTLPVPAIMSSSPLLAYTGSMVDNVDNVDDFDFGNIESEPSFGAELHYF